MGQTAHVPMDLLTATEQQVHQGRLHMRLIQWYLKNHWRIPKSLEMVIHAVPKISLPTLKMVAKEANALQGQPLHSVSLALLASREG